MAEKLSLSIELTVWRLKSTWGESLYCFLYLIALKSTIFAIFTIFTEFTVNNMRQNFQEMKVNMVLKIHILYSHLDFFLENLRAVSDEHFERFHEDIAEIEKRYQDRWSVNALADYCWSLMTNEPNAHSSSSMQEEKFLVSSSSL